MEHIFLGTTTRRQLIFGIEWLVDCYRSSSGGISLGGAWTTIISPDLTNEQQRNGKLLRDEMKLRTNNGEANLWIQRGKVVVRESEGSV